MNSRKIAAIALILLPLSTIARAQSETAPADVVPIETVTTKFGPRIHIAAVVDASGCKNLNGGLLSGAGVLAGGLLAKEAGANGTGIRVGAEAGKAIGNMQDKAARCRQDVNIEKSARG